MTVATPRSTAAPTGGEHDRRPRNVPKLVFLGVVLVVLGVYTQMAFGLEWRTQAGRIGPGFFPRLVGLVTIVVTLVAMALELRGERRPPTAVEQAEDATEPDLGRHSLALALFVVACAVFVWLLGLLGSIVAGVLFLGVTLWFLDPEHRVRGVVLSVVLPTALYLAFNLGLNAGLPTGVLLAG